MPRGSVVVHCKAEAAHQRLRLSNRLDGPTSTAGVPSLDIAREKYQAREPSEVSQMRRRHSPSKRLWDFGGMTPLLFLRVQPRTQHAERARTPQRRFGRGGLRADRDSRED